MPKNTFIFYTKPPWNPLERSKRPSPPKVATVFSPDEDYKLDPENITFLVFRKTTVVLRFIEPQNEP